MTKFTFYIMMTDKTAQLKSGYIDVAAYYDNRGGVWYATDIASGAVMASATTLKAARQLARDRLPAVHKFLQNRPDVIQAYQKAKQQAQAGASA